MPLFVTVSTRLIQFALRPAAFCWVTLVNDWLKIVKALTEIMDKAIAAIPSIERRLHLLIVCIVVHFLVSVLGRPLRVIAEESLIPFFHAILPTL